MLKLKLQYFGQLMGRTDSLEKILMLGKIESRRRRGWQRMRWLAGSSIRWTWVWVSSGSWWWTGKPVILQSMKSQRVRHNWTELNWMHPWSCGLPEVAPVFCVFYEGVDQILLSRQLRRSGTEALLLPPKMWPEVALASFSHRTAAGLEQRALQRLTVTYAIFHTVGAASIEDCYAPQSQPHKACSCIFHRNGIQDNDPASCSGLFIQQPAGKPSQASGPRKCEQLDSMNSVTAISLFDLANRKLRTKSVACLLQSYTISECAV